MWAGGRVGINYFESVVRACRHLIMLKLWCGSEGLLLLFTMCGVGVQGFNYLEIAVRILLLFTVVRACRQTFNYFENVVRACGYLIMLKLWCGSAGLLLLFIVCGAGVQVFNYLEM